MTKSSTSERSQALVLAVNKSFRDEIRTRAIWTKEEVLQAHLNAVLDGAMTCLKTSRISGVASPEGDG